MAHWCFQLKKRLGAVAAGQQHTKAPIPVQPAPPTNQHSSTTPPDGASHPAQVKTNQPTTLAKQPTQPAPSAQQSGPNQPAPAAGPHRNSTQLPPTGQLTPGSPPSSSQHPWNPKTNRYIRHEHKKRPPKCSKINILSANARGLNGKLTSLKVALNSSGADIAAISETHLKPAQSLKIPGYVFIGNNRPKKNGGGVAFLIRNSLAQHVSQLPKSPCLSHEALWIRIDASPPLYVAIYYGKQESAPLEVVQQDLALLDEQIHSLSAQGANILLGDFNSKIGHPTGSAISRNGQYLLNVIQQNNLIVINQSSKCQGVWTWVNPTTPTQRSVIDYVISSPRLASQIQNMNIDEEGHLKLCTQKHKQTQKSKQSDHNSITLSLKLNDLTRIPRPEKVYKWKVNDNTNWDNFKCCLEANTQKLNDATSYEVWADLVLNTAQKSIGAREIKSPSSSLPNTGPVKRALAAKREAKKNLNRAYQQDYTMVPEAKLKLTEAKQTLEETVHEADAARITGLLQKICTSGGVHSKTFWNLKRKALTNGEDLMCVKTEANEHIHGPAKVTEYIATYYENLYKPQSSPEFDTSHTAMIENNINTLTADTHFEHLPLNQPISQTEVQEAIKSLPSNKAAGPNRLIYEFIKNGGQPIAQSLHSLFNRIFTSESPPMSWQDSTMVMLPKSGKKDPEKLENKRGLTLSDVTCKVYERVLLNRITKVLPYTEAQAGARKGRCTTDQGFTLKSVLHERKATNKSTYLAFLDLHKAYDKIWKAAILTTLWQKGIRGRLWRNIKSLNESLTTCIKTRYGFTRKVTIQESIRQGGVLSGTEFSSLIDSLEDALQSADLGVHYGLTKLASLLLMDDIILIANSQTQLQQMLDITDAFAREWHLSFNPSKSKVMIVGRGNRPHQIWKLGQLTLDETNRYTYLGEVISMDLTMHPHLIHLQQKQIAQLNRIHSAGSEESLSRIKMSTFIQLHQRCLLPSLLYNAETWVMSQAEINKLENLQIQAFRKYFTSPKSTPKAAYYLELGLLPSSASVDIMQFKYLWKVLNSKTRTYRIIQTQIQLNTPKSWFSMVKSKLTSYKLPTNPAIIQHFRKSMWHKMINEKVRIAAVNQLLTKNNDSTKLANILNNKQEPKLEPYVTQLSRKRAAAIFRLRCKSTRSTDNMGHSANLPICSFCSEDLASDQHIFTDCKGTQDTRAKYQLHGLHQIYEQEADLRTLERIADFALEIGIVPKF